MNLPDDTSSKIEKKRLKWMIYMYLFKRIYLFIVNKGFFYLLFVIPYLNLVSKYDKRYGPSELRICGTIVYLYFGKGFKANRDIISVIVYNYDI